MGLIDKLKKRKEDTVSEAQPVVEAKVKVEKKDVPTVAVKKVKKTEKQLRGDAYKILLSPIVSEKAAVSESMNTYTFIVKSQATKIDIKNAIKQVYGVIPKNVRTTNNEGKKMRSSRGIGRRNDWKKAMITLSKGQTINIHEGV